MMPLSRRCKLMPRENRSVERFPPGSMSITPRQSIRANLSVWSRLLLRNGKPHVSWRFRLWKNCQMRNLISSLHFYGASRAQSLTLLKFCRARGAPCRTPRTMVGKSRRDYWLPLNRQRPDIPGRYALTRHFE
jgi:hypothetical protein